MRSTDKVARALDQAEALADDPNAAPTVKIAAAGLAMFRGQLENLIPADPDQLDELLAKGSQWMLGLRSDEELALEQELGQLGDSAA